MQTKIYFASSIPAALEVARQELGAEALLVSSRPTPPHARGFGRLEVTFAWDPQSSPASAANDIPLVREKTSPSQRDDAGHRLRGNGFSAETTAALVAGAARRPGDSGTGIIQELVSRIPILASGMGVTSERRTLAFIGPPGRGKTTSLIKIAMKLGLSGGIPVRIYTAGAHCIGAQEQMARFAAILGTPWHAYESLASLNLALDRESGKGLTLIDTPGISPADRDEFHELDRFFSARTDIEKHLVLRADATSADMLHMISHFSGLAPGSLLFTGLDEAFSVVPMVETLLRARIPATYTATGQRIPGDLEEADAERLARACWAGSAFAIKPVELARAAA